MFNQYFNQAVSFVKENKRSFIKAGMTVGGAVLGALASGIVNGMLEDDFEAAAIEDAMSMEEVSEE